LKLISKKTTIKIYINHDTKNMFEHLFFLFSISFDQANKQKNSCFIANRSFLLSRCGSSQNGKKICSTKKKESKNSFNNKKRKNFKQKKDLFWSLLCLLFFFSCFWSSFAFFVSWLRQSNKQKWFKKAKMILRKHFSLSCFSSSLSLFP